MIDLRDELRAHVSASIIRIDPADVIERVLQRPAASRGRPLRLAIVGAMMLMVATGATTLLADGQSSIQQIVRDGDSHQIWVSVDDGFVIWERGLGVGRDGGDRWVLIHDQQAGFITSDEALGESPVFERFVTPAVPRSDLPVATVLAAGTPVIVGLDIEIDTDFHVTTGPPTLWVYAGDDEWVAYPIDAILPSASHVEWDISRDRQFAGNEPADSGRDQPLTDADVIRNFGGIFIEQYKIVRVDGRLEIRGVDVVNSKPFLWSEDETGTLRPADN